MESQDNNQAILGNNHKIDHISARARRDTTNRNVNEIISLIKRALQPPRSKEDGNELCAFLRAEFNRPWTGNRIIPLAQAMAVQMGAQDPDHAPDQATIQAALDEAADNHTTLGGSNIPASTNVWREYLARRMDSVIASTEAPDQNTPSNIAPDANHQTTWSNPTPVLDNSALSMIDQGPPSNISPGANHQTNWLYPSPVLNNTALSTIDHVGHDQINPQGTPANTGPVQRKRRTMREMLEAQIRSNPRHGTLLQQADREDPGLRKAWVRYAAEIGYKY